jgi:hypothetical protein
LHHPSEGSDGEEENFKFHNPHIELVTLLEKPDHQVSAKPIWGCNGPESFRVMDP